MYELLCVIVMICVTFVMLLFIVVFPMAYNNVVVIIIIIDFCGNVWFSFNADVMLPNYGCLFGVLCKSNARGRAFV